MTERNRLPMDLTKALPAALALAALAAVFLWSRVDPTRSFTVSTPTPDPRLADGRELTEIGARFKRFDAPDPTPAKTRPGTWPGFRGPNRDNVVTDCPPLALAWGPEGPTKRWELSLGNGHAAPAVAKGRVYLLDYDEIKKSDMLRCFSLESGAELWNRGYKNPMKRNHGFSRTQAAVQGDRVLTIGPRNHVMCCHALTGDLLWGIDLTVEYGSKVPFWYAGQCPLIDGDTAVLAVAGKEVLLMGVDLQTGQTRWTTPNPEGVVLSHSSIMPMTVGGTRLYLYAGIGAIVGVAADGPRAGTILFSETRYKASVIAPSPLALGDGRVFMTAGYGAGSATFTIQKEGDRFNVEETRLYATRDALASEQQTPILYKGRVFAILPKDAGAHRQEFVCVDPQDITRMLYTSGKAHRFGLGPYLVADGKILILDDDGTLVMADGEAEQYTELARHRVIPDGRDAWGPLVLVEGRLLLRDDRRMICLDLRARKD